MSADLGLREAIVAEARTWVSTKFQHQGRLKGVGIDCVGLLFGVGRALSLVDITEQDFKPFVGYRKRPNVHKMGEAMAAFLVRRETPKEQLPPIGSIAWLGWRADLPMHVCILAERKGRPTMIHSLETVGGCVEHGFAPPWPARVVSWWDFPGVPG
jgi:hypothetical protein